MFPIIKNIDDLLPHINNVPEINIREEPNGIIIKYGTICKPEIFDNPYIRECRGITFDRKTGDTIIRPLHKFFNVNERGTNWLGKLDAENISSVTKKIDGSLCTTTVIDGKIISKSMSSFLSWHANKTNTFINSNPEYASFCKYCYNNNITPIFEYVTPEHQNVIYYPEEALILLNTRHIHTGEYLGINYDFKVKKVDKVEVDKRDINDFLVESTHYENQEGYVVQFNNGEMIKVKNLWYINLHKTKGKMSTKNIAQCVVNGTVDDLKSFATQLNYPIKNIDIIEKYVIDHISGMQSETQDLLKDYANKYYKDRKQFAIENEDNPCLCFAFMKINNKEPNYGYHFMKNIYNENDIRGLHD